MENVKRRVIHPVWPFFNSYPYKILIGRKFTRISDLRKPVIIMAHKSWKQQKSKKYPKGVVKTKPYRSPEGNGLKNFTHEHKTQSSKPKRYRGKKTQTKTQGLEIESETNFKGRCSDLEVYIFNLGSKAWNKFARTMKDLSGIMGWTTAIAVIQP